MRSILGRASSLSESERVSDVPLRFLLLPEPLVSTRRQIDRLVRMWAVACSLVPSISNKMELG